MVRYTVSCLSEDKFSIYDNLKEEYLFKDFVYSDYDLLNRLCDLLNEGENCSG